MSPLITSYLVRGGSKALFEPNKEYIYLPTKNGPLRMEKYSKPLPTKDGYIQFEYRGVTDEILLGSYL